MLKIQTDLEKATHPYVIQIAKTLIERTKDDSLIQETLNKPNKSLDGMWNYILDEAKKRATRDGNVGYYGAPDDNIIYGLAQHYYDEDSLDFEPKKGKDTSKPKTKTKAKTAEVVLPDEDDDVFDF